MKQTGVGKIRENIKNLKNSAPIRNPSLFISCGWGCQKILGIITQFSARGLLQYYRALEVGGGGKENQANLLDPTKTEPPPLPFLGDKEWTSY